jgi:hypothetical protein
MVQLRSARKVASQHQEGFKDRTAEPRPGVVTELANTPISIGRQIRVLPSDRSGSRVTARRDIYPGNGFTATAATHPNYSALRRKVS